MEYDKNIAEAYAKRYPNDTVVVGDAKQYLLDHYKEFDFIWASPPCQTHTRILFSQRDRDVYKPKYPDLSLYEIILFLELHKNKFYYVVENVKPYYKPLVKPTVEIDRHLYWSNFNISPIEVEKMYNIDKVTCSSLKDFDIKQFKGIKNKRQVIRNQVNYEIGLHILNCVLLQMKSNYDKENK